MSSPRRYQLLECEMQGTALRIDWPIRVTEYESAFEMGRAAARLAKADDRAPGVHFAAVEGGTRRAMTPVERGAVEAGIAQEGVRTEDLPHEGSE